MRKKESNIPDVNHKDFEGVYLRDKRIFRLISIPALILCLAMAVYFIFADFTIYPGDSTHRYSAIMEKYGNQLGVYISICLPYFLYYEIKKAIKPDIFFIITKEAIGIKAATHDMYYIKWEDVLSVYIEKGFVNILVKNPEEIPKYSLLKRMISAFFFSSSPGDMGIHLNAFPCSPEKVLKMLNKYMPKEMEMEMEMSV